MKNKIILNFKIIFRNKIQLLNIILISLLICILFLLNTYYISIKNFVENDINNDFHYRSLLVYDQNNDSSNTRKKLESEENILGVFSATSRFNGLIASDFAINNLTGRVDMYAANNQTLPKIILGENFPDNTNNYMICPKDFYPNDGNFDNLDRSNFINTSDYLNKEIEFQYNNLIKPDETYSITFKLIGVYENNPVSIDENICFVNESALLEIFKNQEKYNEEISLDTQTGFYVQVDKTENVDVVTKNLQNKGYFVMPSVFIDYSIFESNLKHAQFFIIALSIIIIAILIFLINKILNEMKNIKTILYYFGINKQKLYNFQNIGLLITIFTSILISIILTLFLKLGINQILYNNPLIFYKRKIITDYHFLIKIFILFIVIAFVVNTILSIIKFKKDINE